MLCLTILTKGYKSLQVGAPNASRFILMTAYGFLAGISMFVLIAKDAT